jgi:hypothetical protein
MYSNHFSKIFAFLLLASSVPLNGCAVDSEAAVAKCEKLMTRLCIRSQECTFNGSIAECEQQVATVLNCGVALDVSDQYDTCVSEVDTFDCSVLFPQGSGMTLPASCNGVILK